MDFTQILGLAAGTAWAAGLNSYLTVAMIGIAGRTGLVSLPGHLNFCQHPGVIALAVVFYLIEFVADKVPWVDSIWDAVHTFLRVPLGALLAYAAFGDSGPMAEGLAALMGGGLALSTHGVKATARLTLNASPEPVTNILASLLEDFIAFCGMLLSLFLPVLMLVLVLLMTVVTLLMLPKLYRGLRRLFYGRAPAGEKSSPL